MVIGDSRLAIQALLINILPSQSKIHHLIRKIQIISISFQKIDYFHVLRKHNTKVDEVVNLSSSLSKGFLILNDISSFCQIP